jgi:hypothetical protein
MCEKTLDLLRSIVDNIEPYSLSIRNIIRIRKNNEKEEATSTLHYKMAESLIHFMINCALERLRTKSYKLLSDILSSFEDQSRFELLKSLITYCPYEGMKYLLLYRLKEETEKAWQNENWNSPFIGEGILNILRDTLSPIGDLMNRMDTVTMTLNYYRYLLIKDENINKVGIWSPKWQAIIKSNYLDPLLNEIEKLIDQFSKRPTEKAIIKHPNIFMMHYITTTNYRMRNMQVKYQWIMDCLK